MRLIRIMKTIVNLDHITHAYYEEGVLHIKIGHAAGEIDLSTSGKAGKDAWEWLCNEAGVEFD